MEFQDLIDFSTPEEANRSDEARYSFLQGGYVEDWDSQGNNLHAVLHFRAAIALF